VFSRKLLLNTITNVFLAALIGFSVLPFGSCKSEIDTAGKAVNEPMDKAKNKRVEPWKKQERLKEAGEKMQEGGKTETNPNATILAQH
jgi:hypothetical protein